MAFHLLLGVHPSTLMDAALDRICQEAVEWPTRRGYIIVPEKMKAEVERRYIETLSEKKGKGDSSAFMMIDVVSFSRFAYRVLSEVGGAGGKSMSPIERTILLHRILKEDKADFSLLSHFSERVGFVHDVDEVLGDFYRYGVSPESLIEMDRSGIDPITAQKISDFGILMKKMDELRSKYEYAPERISMKKLVEVLEKFSKNDPDTEKWPLKRLRFLRDASVWILGFGENRAFTPEECNIVTLLESVVSKITMTAISDPDGNNTDRDICHFGDMTVRSFRKAIPVTSVTPVLSPPSREEALSTIASDYASRSARVREDLSAPVEIKVFRRINDELEYIAARIREMVMFSGYRYRDITVVLCDEGKYGNSLHAAFSRYGLDLFLDQKSRLNGTAWMQYVKAIMDMCCYKWKLPFVMNWIKSGFVEVPPENVHRFENFCLAHGLRTKTKILHCLDFVKSDEEREILSPIAELLNKLDTELKPMTSAKTCQARAVALHNFLVGKKNLLEYWVREWSEGGNQEAALALAASYNAMDDALSALSGPLGDFPITIGNFCDALISSVASQSVSKIPSYVDQITVTDPGNAYRRPCKVMFIVGPDRKNFPFTSPAEGYLKNREREILSEKLCMDFPNHAKDQSYADFFKACALLDVPSERIVFTMQNSVEISSMVLFLKENYPKIRPEVVDQLSLSDPRVMDKEKMRDLLREVLTGRVSVGEEEKQKLLSIWVSAFQMEDLSREGEPDTELEIPSEMLSRRFRDRLNMSVSGVEKYVMCPYNYFSENILGLQEREIQTVKPTEMGTLAHSMMELALTEYHMQMKGASDPEKKKQIHESFVSRDKLSWSRDLLSRAQQIEHFAYTEDPAMRTDADTKVLRAASETLQEIFDRIDPEGYVPVEFEKEFGKSGIPGYEMTLKDGKVVTFGGTIDRVDRNFSDNTYRIVDYKTGEKSIKYDALYAGASVQLPAYMFMYQSMHPDLMPTGVSYMRVTSVKKSEDELGVRLDPDTIAKAREASVKATFGQKNFSMQAEGEDMLLAGQFAIDRIRENCEQIFSGNFPSRPGKYEKAAEMDCQKCKFATVCNGDPLSPKYRFLEKLENSNPDKKINKEKEYWKALKGETDDEADS